ncbi:hypothetical protein K440DRAFT_657284 [Wilcoxina mikolae CBS 423.85]|nr:hypothetical protein K440DRAFT_657284 [Wilcoxina mikolae CBS 423.85]
MISAKNTTPARATAADVEAIVDTEKAFPENDIRKLCEFLHNYNQNGSGRLRTEKTSSPVMEGWLAQGTVSKNASATGQINENSSSCDHSETGSDHGPKRHEAAAMCNNPIDNPNERSALYEEQVLRGSRAVTPSHICDINDAKWNSLVELAFRDCQEKQHGTDEFMEEDRASESEHNDLPILNDGTFGHADIGVADAGAKSCNPGRRRKTTAGEHSLMCRPRRAVDVLPRLRAAMTTKTMRENHTPGEEEKANGQLKTRTHNNQQTPRKTNNMHYDQPTHQTGEWIPNTPGENASVEELTRYQVVAAELILNGTLDAESYVRGCYGQISEGPGVLDCRTLTQRSLEYFTEMTRCPFHDDICLIQTRDQSAFVMDTGNVYFAQLGLNSKFSERLFFRRRTVCSPITMQPFLYSKENTETELLNRGMTGVDPEAYEVCSFFQISGVNASYAFQYNSTGYEVISHFTFDASLYPPLPILQTQTPLYTLSVVTLRAPGVLFLRNYSDPLFYIQTKVPRGILGFNFGAYQMSRPINAVACQDMAMLCSKVTNYCTDWTSLTQATLFGDIISDLIGGHVDDDGSSAVILVSHALADSALYQTIAGRSMSSLQASRYLAVDLQMRLADEQWKVELEGWFRIALARIQLYGLRIVKTPARDLLQVKRFRNAPNASLPDPSKMCNIVKFHSAEHTTLSGAWIIVIFAYVVFVTIFSFGDSWVPFIWKNKTEVLLKPWENNEKLRLLSEAEQMEEPSVIPVVDVSNTVEIAEKGFLIPRKPVPQRQ